MTGLEKVKPGNTYVLRKSEAVQIQKVIDEEVESIKKEQAAVKEAGEKAKEDYSNRLTLKQKELNLKIAAGIEVDLEQFQGHINEDDGRNTGGIVAGVIGGLILIALTVFLMCKAIRMQRFNEMCKARPNRAAPGQNRILVN